MLCQAKRKKQRARISTLFALCAGEFAFIFQKLLTTQQNCATIKLKEYANKKQGDQTMAFKNRKKNYALYETTKFADFREMVENVADRVPDKVAFQYKEDPRQKVANTMTFAECREYVRALATELHTRSLENVKIAIIGGASVDWFMSYTAIMCVGAVTVPIDKDLPIDDAASIVNTANCEYIFFSADVAEKVAQIAAKAPSVKTLVSMCGEVEGATPVSALRAAGAEKAKAGDNSYLEYEIDNEKLASIVFTSGTTGYPRIATHSYKYALGHYPTAKHWHNVNPDGLHFTISDTGWGKALWGKLYGQWLAEGAIFTYDFDRFSAADILPMFAKYNITTFCAPPTMLRMMVKEDISKYDLSSIKHMTTAGEALNPEVYRQFEKATGLQIMEGFGQTELTLVIANLVGDKHKLGSMGKPTPLYDVDILDPDGNSVADGEVGEIVVKTSDKIPCGLFNGYYRNEDKTNEVWYDGYYHTGDTAWRDEDGFYWYVGRVDDVIKSSGYRIGPFEIESVIMELPYVLECGVSAAPDEVRGQVVKASIVLVKGTEPTEELKKEIQEYVKKKTAPYKYPRIVEFKTELPKTISGKIQRNKL